MTMPHVWVVEFRRKKPKAVWKPQIGGYLFGVAARVLKTQLEIDHGRHYEFRVAKYVPQCLASVPRETSGECPSG